MSRIYLQEMVENFSQELLPPSWTDVDLIRFSGSKRLFEYQQVALCNALRALWKYYSDPSLTEEGRRSSFMSWYHAFGMQENLDIPLDRTSLAKRDLCTLLEHYYQVNPENKLSYEQFINRMSFWMATGSGKTLVIVKLLELLKVLMERREIPQKDILLLAHRDDLLDQLRVHIDEFNSEGGLFIRMHELRDYADVKQQIPSLFKDQELNVFYYRSDNLSDERKEKIIDFRTYENDGNWYVLLDEAHKGDKEDSKRQHIYSIMSRNGFLFNFSATFTDPRDIVTTVANYNLSEFIRKGHGKHITVLRQEIRAFRREDDYSDDEKQKIVLKALIMLAYTRQFANTVRKVRPDIYHKPLMMTLVNSVSTEDADLKMFFRELVRITSNLVDGDTWLSAKRELLSELSSSAQFLYEQVGRVQLNIPVFNSIKMEDILSSVFNASAPGEIEILVRPSDRQEFALKLQTSEEPFALVRIGDISNWLKTELTGYDFYQHFKDESYFKSLNNEDSSINILLGSRSFYEGWDSNRPNVITYVNIGTDVDAKKFILQSVGRGVRIEPLKYQRKRFNELDASGILTQEEHELFEKVKDNIQPLETVLVFGTNREALNLVISEMDQEQTNSGMGEISLALNQEAIEGKLLLIPTYQPSLEPLYESRPLSKFNLSQQDRDLLVRYLDYVDDDRVFYALHESPPEQIAALRNNLEKPSDVFLINPSRTFNHLPVLVNHALNYFALHSKDFSAFKVLENEINHYLHIKVDLEQMVPVQAAIDRVLNSIQSVKDARKRYDAGQMTLDELLSQAQSAQNHIPFFAENAQINIENIAHHYYIPVLLSGSDRVEYIRNIIHVPSELAFLNQLEDYCKQPDNKFTEFDWWVFSKLDENMDQVSIPYYYPIENRIANFKPDFIFWLKKGDQYHIVFVDPKGTGRSEYQLKVDGFREIFEKDGKLKEFLHDGLRVQVSLFLYTGDREIVAQGYKNYWYDSIDYVLKSVISN